MFMFSQRSFFTIGLLNMMVASATAEEARAPDWSTSEGSFRKFVLVLAISSTSRGQRSQIQGDQNFVDACSEDLFWSRLCP